MAVWLPSSITPQLSWLKTGLTEGYGGQNSFLPPTLGHFPVWELGVLSSRRSWWVAQSTDPGEAGLGVPKN